MTEGEAGELIRQGIDLQQAGAFHQAEGCYRRVLDRQPDNQLALNLMGTIAIERGNFDAAIQLIGEAVRRDPKNPSFLNNLGHALILNGEAGKGLAHLHRALAISPRMRDALLNAAHANQMLGRAEPACQLYRKAIELDPADHPARLGLADALFELGQDAEASDHLRGIIRNDPGNLDAWLAFAKGHRFSPGDAEIGTIEAMLEDETRPERARSLVHWAAGKMYADIGRYDDAFANFARSKALGGTRFDLERYRQFVDRSIGFFDAAFFASRDRLGHRSDRPIFIVGMPRSGTTLAERILASHPDVAVGGELTDLEKSVRLLTERAAYHDAAFFKSVERLGRRELAPESARYLAVLEGISPSARHVTDKMPHNFQFLGLIALLFPHAKIIHCRRNAMDTCVSCYTQRFTQEHAYNNDLATLGLYYREYTRLMDHWSSVLGERILLFRYESLVADQERETRRLLEFVGLDWNDACLDFHSALGSVRTPSRQQVRQPLNAGSIGQWRRFERHLGPLREALGDLAEI